MPGDLGQYFQAAQGQRVNQGTALRGRERFGQSKAEQQKAGGPGAEVRKPCAPPAGHPAAEWEHLGLSASPPTPQHWAPTAEPPSFSLQATTTWAQQRGPVSWAASADKPCVSSATELKQRTSESPDPGACSVFYQSFLSDMQEEEGAGKGS